MNAKPALEGAWVFRHERRLMGWGKHTEGLLRGQQSPALMGPGGLRQRTEAGGGIGCATPLKLNHRR